MNKEMVEILEMKEELNALKLSTEAELVKINKKIKDNKAESKKLIESKFEEIIDTVNFSVNNNPNFAKGQKNEGIEKVIDQKIGEYQREKDEDFEELTAVVEEIADKLVEENKGIKTRLINLENASTSSDIESAISNTNKIVKVLENDINENIEKSREKINQLKEQEENNLERIETLEIQIDKLLETVTEANENDLSEQIVIMEKRQQGERLEMQDEISKLKEQINSIRTKAITEEEVKGIIEQRLGDTEELTGFIEDIQGLQQMQQDNVKELQDMLEKQDERISNIENNTDTDQKIEVIKDEFTGINEEIKGLKNGQEDEKIKISDLQNKIENLENAQIIRTEEINDINEKSAIQNDKVETLITLVQEQEKQLNAHETRICDAQEIEDEINEKKNQVLAEVEELYGKRIEEFGERIDLVENLQEESQKKLEEKSEGVQQELTEKLEEINNKQQEMEEFFTNISNIESNRLEIQEEMSTKLAEMEEQQKKSNETVDLKISEIDEKQNKIEEENLTKLGKFEEENAAKLGKIEEENNAKIAEIEKQQKVAHKEMTDTLSGIDKDVKKILEKQKSYGLSLNFLNKNIETYKGESDKNLTIVNGKLEELEKVGNAQEEQLAAQIKDVAGKTEELQGKLEELQGKNATQEQQLAEEFTGIKNKYEELEKLGDAKEAQMLGKIQELEKRVTNLEVSGVSQKELANTKVEEVIENVAKINKAGKLLENHVNEKLGKVENQLLEVNNAHKGLNTVFTGKIQELNAKIEKMEKSNQAKEAGVTEKLGKLEEKLTSVQGEKLNKVIAKQEDTSRKVKNLAIAMEERLQVYEDSMKSSIEDGISNSGVKQNIDELTKKVTAQNESINLLDAKAKEYTEIKFKETNKGLQQVQRQIGSISEVIKQETQKNYGKLQASNEALLDAKIKNMQTKSNQVFTKQLNQMQAQNQAIIDEQVQEVTEQISALVGKEIEKIKVENKKIISERLARLQLQYEAEVDKKVKKIQADYDKKLAIMQQALNSYMQENNKAVAARKKTANNVTTQVFAYEPVEDIGDYNKNIYKTMHSNKIKQAAKNFNDDYEDADIINFFDTDDD